jgi:signal transduction histidine kinase
MSRYQYPPGAPPAASNAVEASDGALWLAFEKSVVRCQGGNTTALPEQELFAGYRILFEGRGGTMWISADDGLARWRAGKTDIVRLPATDRPAEVANFLEDDAGTLWMATKGEGIRRTRGDRFTTIGVANGLPTGWIVQLLEDGQGRMWASSSGGIFWVDKRELEEVAEGRRQRVQVSLYDAKDGIYVGSNHFGHPAGFKDDRGRLWFATNSGIAVVDPSWRTRAPRLGLGELRLGGERVELHAGVTPMVRGTPSDLDLAFTALTFAPPDTVSFRYQLRTHDGHPVRDWVDLGSSRALHAAGLEPGDYQLALEARTREGDWNGQSVLRLEFGVRQTFYRTPGFVLLVALAVGLSLLGLHRMHLARTRAGLQALMAERTRIAREIHDTLAQAFVATSVQLECLEEALEGDPRPQSGKIQRHLDTAKKVVEESLDEARRAVWVLRPQAIEPGLVPALETLVNQASGGTTVELAVEGDARELPPLVASNLLRIAQEAVANARRHAQARRIAVRLVFSSDAVALSVTDDGQGMPSSGEHGPSQGILGMKERAAQIGGTLSIESGVQGGAGTTLRVEVAA